jgi:mannosylfructose-phosphate synthase
MAEEGSSAIDRICMLSTHGYLDPVPQLGKTDTGGQVLYVLQLSKALSMRGTKVDVYTRWFDHARKQIDPMPECPGVRVIRIPAGPWEFIPKEHIYDILPGLAANMIGFIRERHLDYDLFHGHYVDAGIVALEVATAFSKPAFFTAHSLGAWKRQRVGGDPEEMDRIFNFSHRIAEELRIFQSVIAQTVTSKEEQGKIQELYGFRPPRVRFIPPGVDVHRFRPLRKGEKEEKTRVALPAKYVFMVSRVSKAKGHDLLLPAFIRVMEEFPHVHLVIGGGSQQPDDEEKNVLARVHQFVRERAVGERVHAVGGIPHEELPPYYRQAALFILPARYEPFGMTALEAMASGVPAVVSTFAGIQENLTPGGDCLIVDPLDEKGLAEAVSLLLRDRGLARRLARAGAQTVREEFSWEAIARKFIEFYETYASP